MAGTPASIDVTPFDAASTLRRLRNAYRRVFHDASKDICHAVRVMSPSTEGGIDLSAAQLLHEVFQTQTCPSTQVDVLC